jgi:hypothetical protein
VSSRARSQSVGNHRGVNFLGALGFALGLVLQGPATAVPAARTPLLRVAGLMLVGWLVAGLVHSVATVTFTGPPTVALIFGLVGIVGALSADVAPRKNPADGPKAAPARQWHKAGARAVRR